MLLSVVVPLYNEEENIQLLYDELKGVLQSIRDDHEIIFNVSEKQSFCESF